uniref:Uncharacterized protein n=1 Tax=Arundo donax TaxID=35708 RepID=A0A0A9G850_ARUDO
MKANPGGFLATHTLHRKNKSVLVNTSNHLMYRKHLSNHTV